MLNSSTIEKLNTMNIGLDIDKIELFIKYYKLARQISNSNLDRYVYRYLQLTKILKEIKPNSKVLKEDYNTEEISIDSFDKLFNKFGNEDCIVAYGKNDSYTIHAIREDNFEMDSCKDLIAVNNVEGIDVMCTYINGRMYRIYGISEHSKLYNFTEQLKDKVPSFIEELACYNLVELRGKITITKDKNKKFDSVICSTLYNLINNINTEDMTIIFDNIIFEDGYDTFDNNWDKIEWLRELSLNVPHHAMIRNVDKIQFESALEEFDEYFREEDSQSPRTYNKVGFKVKDNKCIDNVNYMIVYDTDNVEHTTKFESTVKCICVDIDKSYIKIVGTQCNNGITIDNIEIDDIYIIDKYNISVGNKVKFIVVEDRAILVE